MASIITIKCLKKIIRNKNVLNIYIIIILFIKYVLYKNAHDRTIFLFFECLDLNVSPISPLLPYTFIFI